MNKFFLLFLSITLLACSSEKSTEQSESIIAAAADTIAPNRSHGNILDSSQANEGESLHDSDYGIFHHELLIKDKSLKFFLKMYSQESRLEIFKDSAKTELLQTIPLSDDIDFSELYFNKGLEEGIKTEDYNFDGYRDLLLLSNTGGHNVWYDFFIYDPKSSLFTKDEVLSGLESTSLNPSKEEISFYEYGSWGSFRKGIYKWMDQRLTLVKEVQQSHPQLNPEEFLHTVSLLDASGKMEIASQVLITTEEDNKKEIHCLQKGTWEEFEKEVNFINVESKEQVQRKILKDGKCQ